MLMYTSAVDWGELVWSLIRKGVTVQVIAQRLRVTRPAVIRWRDFGEPDYQNGSALMALWLEYHLPRKGLHFPDLPDSEKS